MLAYLVFHSGTGAVGLAINFLIYLVLGLIIFFILQWAGAQFGVPPKIIQLIGMLIFLVILLSLFL